MSVRARANCVFRAPGQDNFRNWPRARFGLYSGFTLIELLVVIAIIGVLAAILFPVFATAKQAGQKTRCASQLKQLLTAVMTYADDNNGRYVPAASDIATSNLRRWHGRRKNLASPFDPTKGPLWVYLGRSGGVKICPSTKGFKQGFEDGCGGFGYNAYGVGGTFYKSFGAQAATTTSAASDIANSAHTVMFTDTAMAQSFPTEQMIDYSFCEPPCKPDATGGIITTSSPSIHFRHNGRTNVGWCDGHVTSEKMSFTRSESNIYDADNAKSQLGWFGPDDDSLFDNR